MTQRSFAERLEVIESGYEFMLAYAAQGRETDQGGGSGSEIRQILEDLSAALVGLEPAIAEEYESEAEFLGILGQDGGRANAAVRLVLLQPHISSQLIDNLNASLHVRALLTDLFLLDEAIKMSRRTG